MVKADFHIHTADDPRDPIPHTTTELIDHAARLGFGAVAITLHDRQLELGGLAQYAGERGVVLIPGIERTVRGKHVLLLNFPAAASERVQSLGDVAVLKREYPSGLVIAPHAFFPASTCLRDLMDLHADLFDAVEVNYFFTRSVDFNRFAVRWAARHRKPLVGNSDLHRLYQMRHTCTLVDSNADREAVCAAIRQGRVKVHSEPISVVKAASYLAELTSARMARAVRSMWPADEPAAARG
jgi:predicted metal-dependent phosphoesterase TrpH